MIMTNAEQLIAKLINEGKITGEEFENLFSSKHSILSDYNLELK